MLRCPNKSHPDWKSLVSQYGEREAYRLYMDNGYAIPLTSNDPVAAYNSFVPADQAITGQKASLIMSAKSQIKQMEKAFNNPVKWDTTIDAAYVDPDGTIHLNPDKLRSDTVMHEYGHVYIDLLGGLNNVMVAQGVRMLQDTAMFAEIAQNYPELQGEALSKEVLATAIGREGAQIFSDQSLIGRWNTWLTLAYNRLKKILGLPYNVAMELARQMSKTDLQATPGTLSSYRQYQKAPKTRHERILDIKMRTLNNKIRLIENEVDRLSRKINTGAKIVNLDRIKAQLQIDYEKAQTGKGLSAYLTHAVKELRDTYEEFTRAVEGDRPLTSEILLNMKRTADMYALTSDVRLAVESDTSISEQFGAELPGTLSEIERLSDLLTMNYKIEGRAYLSALIAPKDHKTKAGFEDKYRRDFIAANPDATDVQILDHVTSELEKNFTEIRDAQYANIESVLTLALSDIDHYETWIDAAKNHGDDILNYLSEAFDVAEDRAMRKYHEFVKNLEDKHKALVKDKDGETDQLKLYSEILEIDQYKQQKQYFVGEYFSNFYEQEAKLWKELRELRNFDFNSYLEKLSIWKKNNTIANPEFYDAVRKISLEKGTYYAEQWSLNNQRFSYIPAAKYKNPQFNKFNPDHKDYLGKDSPIVQYYEFIREARAEADRSLPEFKQNGLALLGVRKSWMERLESGKFEAKAMTEHLKSIFQRKPDDVDKGEVVIDDKRSMYQPITTDESGKRVHYIPVHWQSKLPLDQQSFDISTMMAMEKLMTLQYAERSTIIDNVLLLREIVGDGEVQTWTGDKKNVSLFSWKRFHATNSEKNLDFDTIKGSNSNRYKMINNFIEDKLYGVKTADENFLFLDPKAWGQIMAYTGTVMLSLNVVAGISNAALGQLLTIAESIGGQFYNKSDLLYAESTYMADLANIVSDIGAREYSSKTNLLQEIFDPLNDFGAARYRFGDNTMFKRLMKQSTLHFINNMGEHWIQSQTMYAVLNNTKVIGDDGKYITKEGSSENRQDGIGLDQLFTQDKNRLTLDPRAKYIDFGGRKMPVSTPTQRQEAFFRVKYRMQQINESLHGAYSDQNKNEMQRKVWGKLLMMLRKWAIPGFKRRFLGGVRAYRGQESKIWSNQLMEFREGTYVTFVRFINNLRKDLLQSQYDLAGSWNELTLMERSNIRKTLTEVAFMLSTLVLAGIMRGLASDAPEEEKNQYYFAAYQFNRLYSEMAVYFNPMEALRILKSPAASFSMIERLSRLTWQLTTDPLGEYQAGRRKGDLRINKQITDLLPWYRQIDRLGHMVEMDQFFSR